MVGSLLFDWNLRGSPQTLYWSCAPEPHIEVRTTPNSGRGHMSYMSACQVLFDLSQNTGFLGLTHNVCVICGAVLHKIAWRKFNVVHKSAIAVK